MTSAKEGQFLAFMEIHNAFNKKGNKMILRRVILTGLALAAGLGSNAWGQAPPATILTIEMENVVYNLDVSDSMYFKVHGNYRFVNKTQNPCRYYLFIVHRRE